MRTPSSRCHQDGGPRCEGLAGNAGRQGVCRTGKTNRRIQCLCDGQRANRRSVLTSTDQVSRVSDSSQTPIKVVPKGLRSYDEDDADSSLTSCLPLAEPTTPRDHPFLEGSHRRARPRHDVPGGGDLRPERLWQVVSRQGRAVAEALGSCSSGLCRGDPRSNGVRFAEGYPQEMPRPATGPGFGRIIGGLHDGEGLPPGRKLLLVLDQFEQWLLANRGREDTDLVKALGHCDEERVRAILMVRDDFLIGDDPVHGGDRDRIPFQAQRSPSRSIHPIHAEKVLAAFGQADGTLRDPLTTEQQEFITQAVKALALQDGMIIPVRLALFFETFKSREWTTKTLQEIGDAEGVGVAFLEKTFNSELRRSHVFGTTRRPHSPYWEPCCPKAAVKSRGRDDLGESFSMRRVMPHDQSHSTNCSASSTRSYFSSPRSTREGGWNLTVGRQPGRLSGITN